jgi:hypothetical protein
VVEDKGFQMSVSVRIYGGFNGAEDVYQVSAEVVGADWGTTEYSAHHGYQEDTVFDSAYNYVVAEANLYGIAPSFASFSAKAPRGFVHRLDLVVEVA